MVADCKHCTSESRNQTIVWIMPDIAEESAEAELARILPNASNVTEGNADNVSEANPPLHPIL